jgi:hypothetical protein
LLALILPLTPSSLSSASVALPVAVVVAVPDPLLLAVVLAVEPVVDAGVVVPVDELVEEIVVIRSRTAAW